MSERNKELAMFRHIKRGSVYSKIGDAQVQASDAPLTDYEVVVVYRGVDGQLWVRRKSEFYDGRFEELVGASRDRLLDSLSIDKAQADLKAISDAYFEALAAIGYCGDKQISLAEQIMALKEENANLRSALNSCTRDW